MIYRRIYTKLWKQDAWFLDLPPEDKLLFIYLFSNECASIAGIYELSDRVMAFETGLPLERVRETLERFGAAGKAYYQGGIVWVCNLRKYNESSSQLVQKRIASDIDLVPDCPLKEAYIRFHETGDTLCIPYAYPNSNDNDNDNESDSSTTTAPAAPAYATPTNLDGWISLLKDPPPKTNRAAILRGMGETLWPDYETPPFSRFGLTARKVKGSERLAQLMWQAQTGRVTGDYLAYCEMMANRSKSTKSGAAPYDANVDMLKEWVAAE